MISDVVHIYAIVFLLAVALAMEIKANALFPTIVMAVLIKILPIFVAMILIFQLCVKYQIWLN